MMDENGEVVFVSAHGSDHYDPHYKIEFFCGDYMSDIIHVTQIMPLKHNKCK